MIFEINREKRIAKGIRRGDNSAMRDFYALFADYLTGICARYIPDDDDLKDVMQDTMISIISHIDSFEYRGDGSLKAWAARITINQALSFIREKKKLDTTQLNADIGRQEAEGEYDDEAPDIEDIPADAINEMIRHLPDGYRTVFNLYIIEGKSHKEIASLLNIKEASSASQLHRAKHLLAQEIINYRKSNTQRL